MERLNIKSKMALLEVLEDVYGRLEEIKTNVSTYYGPTGEQEQRERWNEETKCYEPMFDDDGNPVMRDVYGYLPKTELSDTDKAKLSAVDTVIKALDKLV